MVWNSWYQRITGDYIESRGLNAISEALKINSTLTYLAVGGIETSE